MNNPISTIVLRGDLSPSESLTGKLSNIKNLVGVLEVGKTISVKEYETYLGDYKVNPKLIKQTLETRSKVMYDNVTINEIPVYEVSNTSGGTTIYIAKE